MLHWRHSIPPSSVDTDNTISSIIHLSCRLSLRLLLNSTRNRPIIPQQITINHSCHRTPFPAGLLPDSSLTSSELPLDSCCLDFHWAPTGLLPNSLLLTSSRASAAFTATHYSCAEWIFSSKSFPCNDRISMLCCALFFPLVLSAVFSPKRLFIRSFTLLHIGTLCSTKPPQCFHVWSLIPSFVEQILSSHRMLIHM